MASTKTISYETSEDIINYYGSVLPDHFLRAV